MRLTRTIVALVITIVAAGGCRQTRPEAGLPSSVFDGLFPRVVSNDRGFWFIVTDPDTERQPFVVIGTDDAREVFYAIPKGRRTARLMPLTPFAYRHLDAVRDAARAEARWIATPADAGADLPDTLGWMPRADAAVAWAGTPPVDDTPVMLVEGTLAETPDVATWMVGTAVVRGGKLTATQFERTPRGGVAVIPDGTLPTRPIRAALAGVGVKPVKGVEFSSTTVEIPEGPASPFTTRPAALRAGVDALVSVADEAGAEITLTRPILRNGLALAITDDPFRVETTDVAAALLTLRDVAAGRDLAAAEQLFKLGIASGANGAAGRMRVLELVAAAGFVDWTRQALMNEAEGLSADTALYLARSHYVGGDFERAADFATRAEERFADWPLQPGSHGAGRALLLRARLAARDGDWETAFSYAVDASERFDTAEDAMRAAGADLLAASYATNAGEPAKAVKAAALARSRFYHGNSAYFTGFAEIALADIYARAGDDTEAAKMARFALLRFEGLHDEVGRNRARLAEGRVAATRSRAQAVRDLQIGLEKAQTSGDFVGVVDAASSLVVLGGAPNDATASYGLVIAAGLARTDDPYVRERAAQALTLLCGRGMADAVDGVRGASPRDIAIAKASCAAPTSSAEPEQGMLSALVAQGWAAWRAGNREEAASVAAKVERAITADTEQNAPKAAAEGLFLAAVVTRQTEVSQSDALALRGIRLLGDHIDPTKLAEVFSELADQYVSRGQIWLGADLLRAGMTSAADQGQSELRRDLAMKRVETLHQGGDFDGALTAIYDAEPILETSGASSVSSLARLWTLQADVLLRLGRGPDAAVTRAKADKAISELDPATQVELTLLNAQLAADRRDTAAAKAALVRAERLEAALAEGLVTDEARKVLRARIKLANAEVARAGGETGRAANGYVEAIDALADLASGEDVLRLRIAALSGLGQVTSDDDRLAATIRELEEIRGKTLKEDRGLAPAATAALARLEISFGRPSRALEVVTSAGLDGVVAAETPQEALCIEARAAGLGGRPDAVAMLERCAAAARSDTAADAALLGVIVDGSKTSADKNRVARQLLAADGADLSARMRERLAFVSELAAGVSKRDEAREKRLQSALDRAREGTRARPIVSAVEALVAYLIDTGQPERALPIVDQNSGAFYDLGDNGPGALARLRAEVSVAMLDSVAAFSFASRALAETPDLAAADEAGLLFAAARNAVVLGMWQSARSDAARAQKAAAKNPRLRRSIQAFARRFSLKL